MATEVWQLDISGYAGPENNSVIAHFISDNVVASDTANDGYDLINSWIANIKAKWLALFPNSYYLDYLRARRVLPKFSAVAHQQYPWRNQPGTFGGTLLANQLCPSLKLIPPMGIKSAGKIFMPCTSDTAIADSAYQAGYITAVNTMMTAATANFGTGTLHWQQAVYSRKNSSGSLVLAWSLSPLIGYQKRRRAPVG